MDSVEHPTPHRFKLKSETPDSPSWFFRLETFLVLTFVALLFQIFPAIGSTLLTAFWTVLYVVDVRNWRWGHYVIAECVVIVLLVLIRAWHSRD